MGPHGRQRARAVLGAWLVASVAIVALGPGVAPAVAGGAVFYVDGKHGDDANAGTSLAAPFKTVKAGLWALRYGGRLDVVGYDDYVYREQMTGSQWFINGSAASPIIIQAHGYPTGTRPIVSGAKLVSQPGDGRWTRPDPAHYPDVWRTAWSTPVAGYESDVLAFRQERVFVDVSQPLVRPKTTPTLPDLQANPGSQWWNGSGLYVRLGGWGSPAGASLDPNDHTIEIPHYKGILAGTGSAYVTIQGFRIRHAAMGVGFTGDAHHSTVQDVDASYNYPMGFWTASSYNTFRRISGARNTIQLVKLDDGADHNTVDSAVATENMGQGIKLSGPGCTLNTVSNSTFTGGRSVPMIQGAYGGYVQGVDIEQGANHNTIIGNTIDRNRRGLMLYQVNSSGKALTGNIVRYNRFTSNDAAVVLWDGKYNSTQGSAAITFYRDVYVGNTKAVTSESTTSGKLFQSETFYGNGTAKVVGDSSIYLKYGSIQVVNSIFRSTSGHFFYANTGSKISVSYTSLWSSGLASRNSSATVYYGTGVKAVDPKFLSVDPASADYLYISSTSPAYAMSSGKGPIGARWR